MSHTVWRRAPILSVVVVFCCTCAALAQAADPRIDSDRDGLEDEFEQTVLERFRPTIMVSAMDCAVRPSRFKAGQTEPEAISADGTIYGQVFPVAGGRIEVHYYALWDRDCGRNSHQLDAEHVAVLLSNEGQSSGWNALYWYAGAHEKTICDISSAARAETLASKQHGPVVWVSSGKHAFYLRESMCKGGCGADSCDGSVELAPKSGIVNLGEKNAPDNGSLWITSAKWPLADKMDTDFSMDVIAQLDSSATDDVVTVKGRSAIRGVIQGSDAVADSAGTGAQHTGAALDGANDHTSSGLESAARATGRSLERAWRAVSRSKQK